ncbi:MAG TPA: hybrid sensor histidine kinase/response regulator, partial [Pasteurellaceae bacterium]|nr:hybrid sensor histidine kinase/response regulator [Pasteurellaceae bacterium]
LVEKLELSRLNLARLVNSLQAEVKERRAAEECLAQANQDKTKLMATISHELRTPLNGIIGLSRILLDSNLSDEQRSYLKTINVSAVSLEHIFGDIIDLEKIDSRRIELCRRETDFRSVLNDINNIATLMVEQKKLKFIMQCDRDLPDWLMLDRTRLSQVLWNLISNAVKFTEQGTIQLDIKRLSNDRFSFTVSDCGQGIPAEELDKIFTMYYQVREERNLNRPAGSGIGLAISKSIAELMGGDLTVSSELGKGSTFTLIIVAQEAHKPRESVTLPMTADLYILLVEDIELNVIVAKSMLEKLGHRVDVASTGQQAMEKFGENNYDLVLLDIQLPDITGFQIAQYWRKNYEDGIYDFLPPLIALTANVMQSKAEYQRQGMDDVLRKPLSVEALTHCLADYFGEERPQVTDSSNMIQNTDDSRFDFVLLNELVDMLGTQFVKDNLRLFKNIMPEYMQELKAIFTCYLSEPWRKTDVAEQAHKIKGAAASIGLIRIQQISAQAQQSESKDWEIRIADWIEQLEQQWQVDVNHLEQWLEI